MGLGSLVNKVYHIAFNAKLAGISAVTNGVIAVGVNYSSGTLEALAAGGTQALASFFSTGFTGRLCQHFSPIENRFASYFLGSIIPASSTLAVSYLFHRINGTDELAATLIAPVAISYTTSFITNYITRLGYLRPGNYPSDDNSD